MAITIFFQIVPADYMLMGFAFRFAGIKSEMQIFVMLILIKRHTVV